MCNCFFKLRQLRSVRRSLTDEALHTLVHAFIASRVDYCNALLYGVADDVIRRPQSVLHAAARLITGIRRYEHITHRHCVTLFTGCRYHSASPSKLR